MRTFLGWKQGPNNTVNLSENRPEVSFLHEFNRLINISRYLHFLSYLDTILTNSTTESEYILGESLQFFWNFMTPYLALLLHFKKEFMKIFKIWSFVSGNYF